jgi:hypothetical protein
MVILCAVFFKIFKEINVIKIKIQSIIIVENLIIWRLVMEIRSLNVIDEMRNTVSKIKEHILEEREIDKVLYDIYDNYIEKIYNIILASVDDSRSGEQAALFDEIALIKKILYLKIYRL